MIPVTCRNDPFDYQAINTFVVEPGTTLLEIVQKHTPDPDIVIVCVNGTIIEPEWWGRVRPKVRKNRPIIVTIHPRIHGDKLGSILTTLAVVALVVGASLISGGALAPVFGASFAAGTFGATLTAAGISIAGGLALQALTGPPLQANIDASGPDQRQIAGVSGNSINPGDYLPMVLGTLRASPPPLMPAYTTLEEGEVYINGIVGLCGAYQINNIWLNGSPVELFEDIEYDTRQGLPSDAAPSLSYDWSVQEQQPRLKLSTYRLNPDTATLTTGDIASYSTQHIFNLHPPGADGKFVFRFHWPTGMNVIDTDDSIDPGALPIRIEIKPRSSSVWYKLPEVHFRQRLEHNTEVRQQITLQWVDALTFTTLSPSSTRTAWAAYWRSSPGHANVRDAETVYTGVTATYALGVNSDADGFIIQVLNTAMSGNEEYDVRIRAGWPFKNAAFTTSTFSYSGNLHGFFNEYTAGGTVGSKAGSAGGLVYVESVASFNSDDPFVYSGLASISFKAKGVQIESLSAEFTSMVPLWDGNSWVNFQPTNNPAALYRYVCLNTEFNSQPIPGEVFDEANILEWFEHCNNMGYECNASIANQSLPSVLQLIASCGWASPKYTSLWGVVMERDRSGDEIMQMLTPLNSKDIGTTKEFPKLPHAIRAEFFNESEEFELRDDVVAYAPGYDVNTATIYESVRYDGFTDADQVFERAQFDINQLYMRSIRYVRDVFHEGFLTPRGSLIGLVDDVIERTQRYALIRNVNTDVNGDVTGLELETVLDLVSPSTDIFGVEDPFAVSDPFTAINQLGLTVRLNDGSPSTHLINETTLTDTVTFSTPVVVDTANPNPFERGQVVALGIAGQEYRRLLVMGVEPHQGGEMFRLYLADERPELHAA